MQEQTLKTKKGSNGKWVNRQDAEMDNEAFTPSTLSPHTTSTPSVSHATSRAMGDEDAMSSESTPGSYQQRVMNTAKDAYDSVISRGSDMLFKVDLSAGTKVVRDYPIQAAVGGLIVGFLVGAAVFSRRREA